MRGADLLHLLLLNSRTNPNALSVALNGAVSQSQIQKFLKGTAKEPRRTTLEPIAKHFKVPVDAFYDPNLAWKTAVTRGIIPIHGPSEPNNPLDEWREAHESPQHPRPTPIWLRPSVSDIDMRLAIQRIRLEMEAQPVGVRRSVAALFTEIAENAQNPEYCDRMVDRMLGVLGLGNESQPESTSSSGQPKRQNEGPG